MLFIMKQKIKAMWLYSGIVFCVAILLILVSTLSQVRLSPTAEIKTDKAEQQAFNQTITQNITKVIKEKEDLQLELESQKAKNADFETKLNEAMTDKNNLTKAYEAADMLIDAKNLYDSGKYKSAKEQLQNVDFDALSENSKTLYENLKKALIKKGA